MDELGIVSVNMARPAVLLRRPGGDVLSGIDKRPVRTKALGLTRLNLAGDGQADTRSTRDGGQVHGGPDQAVYAFPARHLGRLGQLAGQPVGPGFMGENLTVTGVTEHDVRIGDVWVFPELAALDVMSVNLRGQLQRRGRDLTGGVPEQD
jgi:MOSC domain-containing protein YiiM